MKCSGTILYLGVVRGGWGSVAGTGVYLYTYLFTYPVRRGWGLLTWPYLPLLLCDADTLRWRSLAAVLSSLPSSSCPSPGLPSSSLGLAASCPRGEPCRA